MNPMNEEICDTIELEIGNKRKKIFLLIDKHDVIWIDTKGLPGTAYLCACFDGISIVIAKCGMSRRIERHFVPIEWAINEWGGPDNIVEALKTRRKMTMDDLPNLKKKYISA